MSRSAELLAKLRSYEIERTALGREPVQGDGWYTNGDGTITRWVWVNGAVQERETLRDGTVGEYQALLEQYLDVSCNERARRR